MIRELIDLYKSVNKLRKKGVLVALTSDTAGTFFMNVFEGQLHCVYSYAGKVCKKDFIELKKDVDKMMKYKEKERDHFYQGTKTEVTSPFYDVTCSTCGKSYWSVFPEKSCKYCRSSLVKNKPANE